MKVRSPLADMDVRLGDIRRNGNDLVLISDASSSMHAEISVSAREVVQTLFKVITSLSGLVFVLGLPFFWLRQSLGWGGTPATTTSGTARTTDINKPW